MEADRIQPACTTPGSQSLVAVKFSIVTPSYCQIKWLRLCVASVADQHEVAVEHIIQDAGSTDGSAEWISNDARVKGFVEKDEGMYDAINRGLRRASGDILAYLNCDEQYLPRSLARVQHYFTTHQDVEVLFTDALLLASSGEPISYRRVIKPNSRHIRLCHLNTLSCATFFRRSVIEKGHLFDQQWKAIGDAVWVEQLLKSKIVMGCLHEPCSAFAFTGSNLGQSERSRKEAESWQAPSSFPYKVATVIMHRLRKALAGAYRHRKISTEIFTMKSPEKRERFTDVRLGFDWTPPEFNIE